MVSNQPALPSWSPRDLRDRLRVSQESDRSPDGSFSARPEGDQVVLTGPDGIERRVAVPGQRPMRASVADGAAAVAFLAPLKGGQNRMIGVLEPDGSVRAVANDWQLSDVDLSADGSKVYFGRYCDVRVADAAGERKLATLPTVVKRLQCLPDGRVLAQGATYVWGPPTPPLYYLVEPDGACQVIGDPRLAESVGQPLLEPLHQQYDKAYPGASPEQHRLLEERFGYNTPRMRHCSPTGKCLAFELRDHVAPLPADVPGIYLMRPGLGPPLKLEGLSEGELHGTSWSPKEEQVGLELGAGREQVRIALADATTGWSRLLPLPSGAKDPAFLWSENGRDVAVQVSLAGRSCVYCYDRELDRLCPLPLEGKPLRWEGADLVVGTPRGEEEHLPVRDWTEEEARRYLVGYPPEAPAGTIRVEPAYVQVGSVRVPRKSAPS